MTHEEAGQIVLEGNAFRPCKECAGEGRVLIEVRTDHEQGWASHEIETYQLCRPCGHTGQIVHDDYRVACRLLDKKIPIPPPRKRRFPPAIGRAATPPQTTKPDFSGLWRKHF